MIISPRFLALLILTVFCLSGLPANAQENADERTAGRQAGGESSKPEAAKEDKAVVEDEAKPAPATDIKKEFIPEKAKVDDKGDLENSDKKPQAKKTELQEQSSGNSPKILKTDFASLESNGLYSNPQDGSLGRDLWTNTRRSAVLAYLPQLPPAGSSPTLQSLTSGVLLSSAQAGLIVNDIQPEQGSDILTLRLMKLMDLGMTDQALKIYSELGQPPYHPNLAQAGIMALLFNAEKSLACLEYKTVEDRNFSGPFWNDIKHYCNFVLESAKPSPAALETIESQAVKRLLSGGAYTLTYEAQKLQAIPLFDRAILTAENIINFGLFGLEGVNRIAPDHLVLALKKPGLSKESEFLLTMKMVEYGLKNRAEWEKIYSSFKFGGTADEQKIITIEALPGWQQLPALFQNAKTHGKGPEQNAASLHALSYVGTYGPAAAYPFAEFLTSIPVNNLSTGELTRIARVLHGADKDIPASWFDALSKRKIVGDQDTALYVLTYVAKAYQRFSIDDRKLAMDAVNRMKNSPLKENLSIIIENVDNTPEDQHNVNKVYDNDLNLTFSGNYVMPSKRVWDRLLESSQNQSIGETVLLSALLLNEKPLMDLYPGVLSDVLKGLRAVGLTRSSKNMAQEAILESL